MKPASRPCWTFPRKSAMHDLTEVDHASSSSLSSVEGSTQFLANEQVEVRRKEKLISSTLVRIQNPRSVLIVAKAMDKSILQFTQQLAIYFIEQRQAPCSLSFDVYIDEKLQKHDLFSKYSDKLRWWNEEFCRTQHDKIDMIITLGG